MDLIIGQLRASIQGYIKKLLTTITKFLVLIIVGVPLLASGAIFVLIGTVNYLSLIYPSWLAWDIVGVIALLIGIILLLVMIVLFRGMNLF